jgi:hypothetical protein
MADIYNPSTWWSMIKPDAAEDKIWDERIAAERAKHGSGIKGGAQPQRKSVSAVAAHTNECGKSRQNSSCRLK